MGKHNNREPDGSANESKAVKAEAAISSSSENAIISDVNNISVAEDVSNADICMEGDDAYGALTPAVRYAQGLMGSYRESLSAEPLKTKMITSCAISLIGEVVGGYIKRRNFNQLMNDKRNQRHVMLGNMPPILDLKRLAIFGVYGFAITGPVFHWWYGFLEKTVRNWQINSGNLSVLAKIAMDRLVFTPPFLLFTLAYMQFLQTFNVAKTSTAIKNIYAGAIYLNWKVWTVAQAVNFKYVPLEYRVLFGNLVALWWNVMLSLKN